MKITRILIKILLIASLISGGFYVAKKNGSIDDLELVKKLEEKKEQFQGSVKGITDNVSNQTQELTTRGQEVGTHVNNILGAYIKPAEDNHTNDQSSENSSQSNESSESNSTDNQNKPIYEETLDYGRYLYCQQVIEDYEDQHP